MDSTWRRAQVLRLIRGTQDLTNIANEMPYKLLYGYYEPLVAVTRSYPASTQLEALDVRHTPMYDVHCVSARTYLMDAGASPIDVA